MNVIIRTADQTRKAETAINPNLKTADIIQAAIENWQLPTDTDYSLVDVTKSITIAPNTDLLTAGIQEGDILEIQPILVAG